MRITAPPRHLLSEAIRPRVLQTEWLRLGHMDCTTHVHIVTKSDMDVAPFLTPWPLSAGQDLQISDFRFLRSQSIACMAADRKDPLDWLRNNVYAQSHYIFTDLLYGYTGLQFLLNRMHATVASHMASCNTTAFL